MEDEQNSGNAIRNAAANQERLSTENRYGTGQTQEKPSLGTTMKMKAMDNGAFQDIGDGDEEENTHRRMEMQDQIVKSKKTAEKYGLQDETPFNEQDLQEDIRLGGRNSVTSNSNGDRDEDNLTSLASED